ncbi:MAG: FIST N-terminal domain-containing protein [Syntrophobacteraceae bacterium]|nr:FIST N-terminal domain-containing protein [Syntrophobacteraceae bacterium]
MSATNIEVGYGVAAGTDSFAAGLDAARQAAAGIREHSISLALVFASVRYDLEEMLRGIQCVIPGAPILGTTTAGEICNGARSGTVVVVLLASPYMRVAAGIGEKVSSSWEEAVLQAVRGPDLAPYFGADTTGVHKMMTLEGRQAFGLLFSPGNTRYSDSRSFEILEKLKQLSENRLPIFGGSSADDWRMESNFVLHGGRACKDSLLVAVIETSLQFGMAFHHGFAPGSEQVVITRAQGHEVKELNGRPAAEVFAQLLGESTKALEGKHLTFTTGRPVGIPDPFGQYSICVASFLTPDGGIRFSQPIARGTALTLMQSEPHNLIAAGQEAFRKALVRGNVERPAASIVFSCAVQQKLLGERIGEEIESIMGIAPDVPLAGFYSFGEQGLSDDGVNRHNNAVITILIIGKDLSYAARVASENTVLRRQLEQNILDLKKQEKIIREAEKKYRSIFENDREGIYQTTPEGRFLDVNPAMARMYGYGSPEEMILQVVDRNYVLPEEWERLKRLLAAQTETGDFEVEQRRKDGSTFWASLRVHAVYGEDGRTLHWEGRCIDITERRKTEEELRQTSALIDMIVENIPNMIFLKDAAELRFDHVHHTDTIVTPHIAPLRFAGSRPGSDG